MAPMPARPAGPGFEVSGALTGIAGAIPVLAIVSPPLVAEQMRPIRLLPAVSFERPILEGFLRDLAVAPELAGELVALYAEQHPALVLRFVSRAVSRVPDGAAAILAAARRREAAHGLEGVALVLQAAVALAAPIPEAPALPPVILDFDCETLPA
jgi:hypothetical protein